MALRLLLTSSYVKIYTKSDLTSGNGNASMLNMEEPMKVQLAANAKYYYNFMSSVKSFS